MIALGNSLDVVGEPQLSVAVMGIPLDAVVSSCLFDLTVSKTIDSADQMSMRLAAWDPDLDVSMWIDDSLFAPGVKLGVAMGYAGALAPVFDGDVVGYEMEMSGGDRPALTVEAYGPLHRLGRGRRAPQEAPKRSYGAVISDIAQRHRLVPRVEGLAASQLNDKVTQQSESDLEFLSALAEEIGYEFFVDHGVELVFRPVQARALSTVVITSAEIVQFSGRIDAAGQLGRVEGSTHVQSRSENEPVAVDNPDSFDFAYSNTTSISALQFADLTRDQLQARVDAELLRIRETYLSVDLTCFGRTDVQAGGAITIGGVSRRFDGNYSITRITHSFSPAQGFRTRLSLKGVRR